MVPDLFSGGMRSVKERQNKNGKSCNLCLYPAESRYSGIYPPCRYVPCGDRLYRAFLCSCGKGGTQCGNDSGNPELSAAAGGTGENRRLSPRHRKRHQPERPRPKRCSHGISSAGPAGNAGRRDLFYHLGDRQPRRGHCPAGRCHFRCPDHCRQDGRSPQPRAEH